MAIINSYPKASSPATGDLLIGTDISTTPSSTKTFTIGSINALAPQGTVTSVALTAPAAFSVAGSPITSSGTIAITGAGNNAQFVDGTGALQTIANLPFIDGTGVANRVPFFVDADTISSSGLTYTTTGGGSAGNLPLYSFGGSADISTTRIILSDIFCNNIQASGGVGNAVQLLGDVEIGDASSDTCVIDSTVSLLGPVKDKNNALGTTGKVLVSNSSSELEYKTSDAVVGYKTYVAQITQSGTNAPVATVLQNDTGLTFTWARNALGVYEVGASSSFVVNKTWAQITGSNTAPSTSIVILKTITTSQITFNNVLVSSAALVEGIAIAFVEIRIYP